MLLAITRKISPALANCELTHLQRTPIDIPRARAQHARYEHALEQLGARLLRLPSDDNLPDCVFIEDAALVLEELAVLLLPGAPSRQPEVTAVAEILQQYRPLARIEPPGTMDGGDILRLGKKLYVGKSSRTNAAGIQQLRALVKPHGYAVEALTVTGCLHLKSAVTQLTDSLLLHNPAWISAAAFPGFTCIDVEPEEPSAANALAINNTILYPDHFPTTAARLEKHGLRLLKIPTDELAKAEGAITCCCLLLNIPD